MKPSWIVLLSLGSIAVSGQIVTNDAQPLNQGYFISDRGAHHRTWWKIASTTNVLGEITTKTNQSYVELATGLHYEKDGQWLESKEEVISIPEGGAATNGPHKVIFSTDLDSAVAIDMRTPDGQRFQSRILGLAYFNLANGSNVLIGEIKSSRGVILPPNQVLYEDAFTDFKADVLYTYTRAGFEQDIILRERPAMPEAF